MVGVGVGVGVGTTGWSLPPLMTVATATPAPIIRPSAVTMNRPRPFGCVASITELNAAAAPIGCDLTSHCGIAGSEAGSNGLEVRALIAELS